MTSQQQGLENRETPDQQQHEAEAAPAWQANAFLGLPFPDIS